VSGVRIDGVENSSVVQHALLDSPKEIEPYPPNMNLMNQDLYLQNMQILYSL
jgi:hypothetical protein